MYVLRNGLECQRRSLLNFVILLKYSAFFIYLCCIANYHHSGLLWAAITEEEIIVQSPFWWCRFFLCCFLLSRSVNISIMMIMMMMIIIIKRRCSIFVVIISIISPFEIQLSLQQQQKSCRACTLHIQSVYRQQDEAEPLQQPAVKGQSTGGGGYQRAGGPCRRV